MMTDSGQNDQSLCVCVQTLFLFILFLCCSNAQTAELPRVFIVHSYEPDNLTSKPQDNGLVKGFAGHGFVDGETVTIERFFMDTKRTFTKPEQVEARGREALARIKAFKPDLVITVDDNAARTVMLSLVDRDIPVVFTGINVRPEVYNRGTEFMASRRHPGHNVTGVYEKLYIEKSVQAMKEIVPDLKKIVFIVDSSLTGNAIRQQIESEFLAGNSGILYTIRQVSSFDEYKHLIRWINSDPEIGAYYPMAIRLAAENGSIVQTREIMRWTLGHVRKPAMSINYVICKLGSFGGVSVDFMAMGRQAGQKGALILKGQPAGEISIQDAAKYALIFNIARAKQLGMVIPPELLGAADQVYDTMGFAVIPQPFHILIVHSNEKGLGTGTDIEKEVLAELGRNDFVEGNNLKISRFYMQTRRTYRTPEQIYERGQAALEKVKQVKPDLVIILEDVAAKEVMLPLVDSSYPVLFGGISLSPEKYNATRKFMSSRVYPDHNVSGVTGEYQYEKSMQAVQLAFPEAKNLVLITSEGSFWQEGMNKILKGKVAACDRRCNITSVRIESASTLKEFKRLVLKYNGDPDVDVISAVSPIGLVREDGTVTPLSETLSWLFAHQTKPGFTFSDNWVEYGYLIAAAIDFETTGRQLGQQTIRVLRGADPGDLPIQSPAAPYIAVNLARARQLGVELPVEILEAAQKVYHTMEPEKAH
ncbi:MAG: hypothetical protein JRJ37_05465 [Deltaproteobacteria bacterium]|nr:hypothetical protein [Deltaproteobacteria bacterium]